MAMHSLLVPQLSWDKRGVVNYCLRDFDLFDFFHYWRQVLPNFWNYLTPYALRKKDLWIFRLNYSDVLVRRYGLEWIRQSHQTGMFIYPQCKHRSILLSDMFCLSHSEMSFRNPLRNWNKKPPPIKAFVKLFTKFLKVHGIGYIMSCSEIVSVKPANDIPSVSARKRVSAGYTAHESI